MKTLFVVAALLLIAPFLAMFALAIRYDQIHR
jgi:hypothetical protein